MWAADRSLFGVLLCAEADVHTFGWILKGPAVQAYLVQGRFRHRRRRTYRGRTARYETPKGSVPRPTPIGLGVLVAFGLISLAMQLAEGAALTAGMIASLAVGGMAAPLLMLGIIHNRRLRRAAVRP